MTINEQLSQLTRRDFFRIASEPVRISVYELFG